MATFEFENKPNLEGFGPHKNRSKHMSKIKPEKFWTTARKNRAMTSGYMEIKVFVGCQYSPAGEYCYNTDLYYEHEMVPVYSLEGAKDEIEEALEGYIEHARGLGWIYGGEQWICPSCARKAGWVDENGDHLVTNARFLKP
jgi:hypothetical protein